MEQDRKIPVALIIIGIGFALYSNQYPIGSLQNPGVGFFPLLIGIGLAGSAGVHVLQRHRSLSLAGRVKTEDASAGEAFLKGKVYATTGILLAFAIFHSVLGYWTSTFGAMVALLRVAGVPSWTRALIGGAITAFVSYLVFEHWLGMVFPEGCIR